MTMKSIRQGSILSLKGKCPIKQTVQILAFLCPVSIAMAQDLIASPDLLQVATGKYESVSRDGNSQVWQKITLETNGVTVTAKTNSFVELATSAAYLVNGQWLNSSDQIQITKTGAIATNSQHKVAFLGNINSQGSIDLTLPEGDKHLTSTPVGLSYFDTASGKSVMIAELTNSVGQLLQSGNQVLYPDAFTDFAADLLYINHVAGFEQLVVLRQQPPSPAEWDLDPETTVLQVITEFFNSPQPQIFAHTVGGLPDEHLDFDQTQMPRGFAFALGDETNTISVTKQWLLLNQRQCLVESAPYKQLLPLLNELPSPPDQAKLQNSQENRIQRVAEGHRLPLRKYAKQENKALQIASLAPSSKGVVIDYTTATSQTNLTFQADTTYFIRSNVTLSGTTVFEGGAVIKFTNSTSAKLSIGTFTCKTGPYRMVILTSKDDNTVGETISGSTGSPTNSNGATYISGSTGGNYKYMRFSYAGKGISGYVEKVNGGEVWHCQFYRCSTAVLSQGGAGDYHNVLFSNCGTAVDVSFTAFDDMLRGEHITADNLNVFYDPGVGSGGTVTNCIFTSVTNIGADMTLRNCVTNSSSSGFYQTVGAASYLLADGSTNRNSGTTNISTTLGTDIKKLTTYPPLLLFSNITTATTLSPQAQRDTDLPDLGYHYASLDYVANARSVSSTLTLTNGVAVGTYGGSGSYGFSVSGTVLSQGRPEALNYIVRYNTVQEQSTTNWSASSVGQSILIGGSGGKVQCRFTGWSIPGASGEHLNDAYDSTWNWLMDCQFTGSQVTFNPGLVGITNCLFERTYVYFEDHGYAGPQWYLFNNLFYGGTLYYRANQTNLLFDSLFDRTTITPGAMTLNFSHNYNAYVTNQNRLSPNGANDKILTNNPIYLTSYLGSYYYPTNGGILSTLTNAGSRAASSALLYHYTCWTNQVKEVGSTVEIGFHYVATDSSGLPLDNESDGAPDYLEDANGNGSVDGGETDWTSYNSLNGLSSGSGLQVFTPLK